MRRWVLGRWVLVGGFAVLIGAALVLVATGNTDVRFTADNDNTQPMWVRWIPVAVGILLVRVVPWRLERTPGGPADRRQAWVLLASAGLFAVLLKLFGLGFFEVLKALLMLAVPLALFRWWGGKPTAVWPARVHWAPAVPVAAYLGLSYIGPLAAPVPERPDLSAVELVLTVIGVFFINSVLEEYFYRRWLQTRWEQLLGPWPAILLSSITWAVWHIALQGRGELGIDLASVLVNQGVQGLFLGYLWSRYRRMWPLIAVHGAINSVGLFLSLM
jgi:membrane protease YdiL (CAAX protease family)